MKAIYLQWPPLSEQWHSYPFIIWFFCLFSGSSGCSCRNLSPWILWSNTTVWPPGSATTTLSLTRSKQKTLQPINILSLNYTPDERVKCCIKPTVIHTCQPGLIRNGKMGTAKPVQFDVNHEHYNITQTLCYQKPAIGPHYYQYIANVFGSFSLSLMRH